MEWFSPSTATKIPSRTGAEKKTVGLAREITQGLGSTVVLEAKSGEPSELHPLAPWAPWAPCRVEVERLSRKSGGGTISIATYYLGEPAQFINQGARLNPGLTNSELLTIFCPDWYRNRTHHLLARGSVGMPGILEWWGCNTLKNEESYLFFHFQVIKCTYFKHPKPMFKLDKVMA